MLHKIIIIIIIILPHKIQRDENYDEKICKHSFTTKTTGKSLKSPN